MNNMCSSQAPNGDWCDKGQDHEGPHIHISSNMSHAWGLER